MSVPPCHMHGLPPDFFGVPLKKSSGAATKNARSCEYIDVDCLWRRTVRGCVNSPIYSLFIVKTLNDKYI